MPIARPEIACHPNDLLTCLPQDAADRRWIVAQTLARQEKSLARDLLRCGIPFYLPLMPRRLSYKGRQASSYVPLYPGFVFLYANADERQTCLATGRIAVILEIGDQLRFREDLLRVANAIANETAILSGDSTLLPRFAGQSTANLDHSSGRPPESVATCGPNIRADSEQTRSIPLRCKS